MTLNTRFDYNALMPKTMMKNVAVFSTQENEFSRNVWSILGLPFDLVSLQDACSVTNRAIANKQRCFLTTPNLNFLITAQSDEAFFQSVMDSDLSVADGMPIIWVAKFLGIPLPERVAGSDLFAGLSQQKQSDKKISVFFFGGQAGVAEQAYLQLNKHSTGMSCCGFYDPGFVSVEAMSSEQIIDMINQANPDFLVVALGAGKGQAWIQKNRHQLKVPVISHLGAVINFFAGTVKRSPQVFQYMGLEWLWRIYQEPVLWKRYFRDGLVFLRMLLFYVIPYRIWLRIHRALFKDVVPVKVKSGGVDSNAILMTLDGACTENTIDPLRALFADAVLKEQDVIVDLEKVTVVDPAFIGLCLMLLKYLKLYQGQLSFRNVSARNRKIFNWNLVGFLLH